MARKQYASYLLTILTLIFCLVLVGCGAPEGNPLYGKRSYTMHNCSSCHGAHGNDGRAVDIASINMRYGSFIKILRRTDAPIMPYYPESKINKQDAADIYAYLKSVTSRL